MSRWPTTEEETADLTVRAIQPAKPGVYHCPRMAADLMPFAIHEVTGEIAYWGHPPACGGCRCAEPACCPPEESGLG